MNEVEASAQEQNGAVIAEVKEVELLENDEVSEDVTDATVDTDLSETSEGAAEVDLVESAAAVAERASDEQEVHNLYQTGVGLPHSSITRYMNRTYTNRFDGVSAQVDWDNKKVEK